jgi:hypothetical protein
MATTMEAATASAVTEQSGLISKQFQGLFQVIAFTFTFDEDSIANLASSSSDLTVVGAQLGDFCLIAPTIDVVDTHVWGWVQATDTVTIMAQNLEEVDANTTLAGNSAFNGLLLRPNQNVVAWKLA